MTDLLHIIKSWLTTDPSLKHWRISRRSYDWLTCDCIDHAWAEYPSFQITEDSVIIHGSWTKERIQAANPKFFDILHYKLIQLCKETNANIA